MFHADLFTFISSYVGQFLALSRCLPEELSLGVENLSFDDLVTIAPMVVCPRSTF